MTAFLIRGAEIEGCAERDLRIDAGRISEIGRALANPHGVPEFEAAGGVLLPGLHDHHLHLFALAAARTSVACGPPEIADEASLKAALAGASISGRHGGDWIRGVGYHESVAGELDRDRLDAVEPSGRPVRIQHRSGAMWILNSAALERLGLEDERREGFELDPAGRPTGRLYFADDWLRERIGDADPPGLGEVSRDLARCGVTGVTDATPGKGTPELALLDRAIESGALEQRLVAMSCSDALPAPGSRIEPGPVKLMLREVALPELGALTARIAEAHAAQRAVAIHCVTRAELVMAAEAIRGAGPRDGDRIEHASIAPPDTLELLVACSLTVVTQPNFIWERGDVYLRDVDERDQPWLYRGGGFIDAGVPLGGGTDAPYGAADPWRAMRSAVERRTRQGRELGGDEALSPERALALFTTPPEAPGGDPRRLDIGAPADLCLLDRPWSAAREALSRDFVAATWREGELVYASPALQRRGSGPSGC